MNISRNLNQEDFQELLISVYTKGNESKEINTQDIVNEIIEKIMNVCTKEINKTGVSFNDETSHRC
jgi:hypothetical protein